MLVPLLAFVFAIAFAPAAFAAQQGHTDLESMALQIQEEGAGDSTGDDYDFGNMGIGEDLLRAVVTVNNPNQVYSGKELRPGFTVTLDGKVLTGSDDFQSETADYFYFYMNNVAVGDSSKPEEDRPQVVVATFSNEAPYVYVKEGFFTIKPFDVKNTSVSVASQTYTGKPLKPSVAVKTSDGMTLRNGKDYTVSYSNNVKVGNGKVTIKGKGNYGGKKTVTFKIKKATIADAKFSKVKDQMYNGKKFTPAVKAKYKGKVLKKNKDYTIAYKRNKKAGVAAIVIKGKKNLKGTHKIYFVIKPVPVGKCEISHGSTYTWNGSPIYPWTTIKYKGMTLKRDKDYTLTYSHNVEPNGMTTPTVRINTKGNYTGSTEYYFTINKRNISDSSVKAELPYTEVTYNGLAWQPVPTLTYNGRYLNNSDIYWAYPQGGNVEVGTGYVYVYAQPTSSHYTGSRTLTFKIKKS